MCFEVQERSHIPVSLSINGNNILVKDHMILKGAQFTTVPKHDS